MFGGPRESSEQAVCAYGEHLEKSPNKFERMKSTHPKIYDYCIRDKGEGGLGMGRVLDYVGIPY